MKVLNTTPKPSLPTGRVTFDNYDIVRLVRIEAQRQLGYAEADIVETRGGVTSAKTGNVLPLGDLVEVVL